MLCVLWCAKIDGVHFHLALPHAQTSVEFLAIDFSRADEGFSERSRLASQRAWYAQATDEGSSGPRPFSAARSRFAPHHPRGSSCAGRGGPAQKEEPQAGPFLLVASPGRDEIIYIPGTGMISTTSIHAPGIWKWGWSLPNIFVATSANSACTIE